MKKEGLTTDNSFGVASVTLGVTGIALAFFSNPLVGLVLGIVGLVFSKNRKCRERMSGHGEEKSWES